MKDKMMSGLFLLLVATFFSGKGWAQGTPGGDAQIRNERIEVSGGAGWAGFPDEGMLQHFTAGALVRIRLVRGLKFAPELTYMYRSQADRDLVFVPNLVYEFRRNTRVVPYVIGGVGILRHYEKNPYWEQAANGSTYGIGFGTKIFVKPRIYVAPEVRFGWEPLLRIGGSIGFLLR
jgi:hypothetical protein